MNKIFLSNNILYKIYLYYNLFYRYRAFKKKLTYSQNQEDLFIDDYFKNLKNGFYVDIGCYHPIRYNNTALLFNRGWKGVNIDMNQTSIDLFNILSEDIPLNIINKKLLNGESINSDAIPFTKLN